METELLLYETRYPAAVITLNCPQTRNALSAAMVDAIMLALRRAEDDSRVRALIVTGAGSAFSAGMDLKELRSALDKLNVDKTGAASLEGFRGEELVDRLYRFPTSHHRGGQRGSGCSGSSAGQRMRYGRSRARGAYWISGDEAWCSGGHGPDSSNASGR